MTQGAAPNQFTLVTPSGNYEYGIARNNVTTNPIPASALGYYSPGQTFTITEVWISNTGTRGAPFTSYASTTFRIYRRAALSTNTYSFWKTVTVSHGGTMRL